MTDWREPDDMPAERLPAYTFLIGSGADAEATLNGQVHITNRNGLTIEIAANSHDAWCALLVEVTEAMSAWAARNMQRAQ